MKQHEDYWICKLHDSQIDFNIIRLLLDIEEKFCEGSKFIYVTRKIICSTTRLKKKKHRIFQTLLVPNLCEITESMTPILSLSLYEGLLE
jgi:hypothetical protein